LFVVLLVLTSMLSTAGFIVFVSATRPVQPQLDALSTAAATARQEANANLAAKQAAEEQRDQEIQAHQADRAKDAQLITLQQQQLNEGKVQIAQLQAEKTNLEATVNTLNSNLSLTTATVNKLQEQVNDLRTTNDGLVKRAEEDSRRLSDLSSQSDSMETSLSQTQEKLQAELESNQKLSSWVQGHGGTPTDIVAAGSAPVGPGAPAINGHITEKRVIDGNTYVTISVGSADGVARGMQFYVLDSSSGQFLGIITVDTVDSNNAVGRLDGEPDKVAQVHAGNDVKTQLRGS
jgi:hypothetical protein